MPVRRTRRGSTAPVTAPASPSVAPVHHPPAPISVIHPVGPGAPAASPEPHGRAQPTWWMAAAVGLVLTAAVVLRFWTTSDLWLDEAQSVAIAHLPLSRIPAALRQDGSPPLYYFLLHFWMQVFGASDLAVRSLSGIFGVASLPLTWLVARRAGARAAGLPGSRAHGRQVAWAATLVVATSPFAVRYSTEARMYMLIVVLVLGGYLALTAALTRPTLWRLGAVALVSGLLMLTHYWSLYLLAAVALELAWLCYRPGRSSSRNAAVQCLCALALGSALFAAWVPSLRYQLLHTGTPWAKPAYPGNLGTTISDYFGMGTNVGRLLGFLAFGLALFGLFGRGLDGNRVTFDLRGRPAARPLAFAFAGTMLIAVAGSETFGGAYAPRYTVVALVPFVLLVALGVGTLVDHRVRRGVVAVLAAGGLAAAVPNVTTQRTQASEAAAVIAAQGYPGDVVVYCPDQVAPSMNRLLPAGRFVQMPYPDGSPARVDWVDYATRYARSNPATFAREVAARAGNMHNVWVVWSPAYPPTTPRCLQLLTAIEAVRPLGQQVFGQNPARYYEYEFLERFTAPADVRLANRRAPRGPQP